MRDDERTYSKSEIREQRRKLSRLVALEQRQLDAYAKMDEAADELAQVEREIAALTSGKERDEEPGPADSADDPGTTGGRSVFILKARPGIWLSVRQVLSESAERGWTSGDEHARQSYRASLRRLARANGHIERDESGITHLYRWVPNQDNQPSLALVPVLHADGSGHDQAAYQGGQIEG